MQGLCLTITLDKALFPHPWLALSLSRFLLLGDHAEWTHHSTNNTCNPCNTRIRISSIRLYAQRRLNWRSAVADHFVCTHIEALLKYCRYMIGESSFDSFPALLSRKELQRKWNVCTWIVYDGRLRASSMQGGIGMREMDLRDFSNTGNNRARLKFIHAGIAEGAIGRWNDHADAKRPKTVLEKPGRGQNWKNQQAGMDASLGAVWVLYCSARPFNAGWRNIWKNDNRARIQKA